MKTVKVRIAVAVAPDGQWNSCGFSSGSDDDAMGLAVDPLPNGERRYWLTAELQVPEATKIAATVRDKLTDEDIDAVFNAMPGGPSGFLRDWGYRQFARAIREKLEAV